MKNPTKPFFNHSSISLLTFASILVITPAIANAQNPAPYTPPATNEKIGLSVGINAIATKSAYDTDDNISFLPSAFYDNGTVYARGSQFGGYLINDNTNEIAGFLQIAGKHFDPDEANNNLEDLSERKASAVVGASYLRRTSIGGFKGQIATDISGRSDGTIAKLSYITRFTPGKWTIYPSAGLEWVDEDYNEYYYGVSQQESNNSGVEAYTPDSSFSPYINLNGTYTFNDDWDLFIGQSINFLSDEQKDSPMVDDDIDYRTTLGLLYKF